MRLAFLGPEGTFTEAAARIQLARADSGSLVPFRSFPAVVSSVERGLADAAILPIENSLEGTVSGTVDLLIHDTSLKICAEVGLPVSHVLAVVPGTRLDDIRTVFSHPQALGQCRRYLDCYLPDVQREAALSTAASVAEIMSRGDASSAAIGTQRAAELFGAEILARDIQDNDNNVTRFVVLANEDAAPTGRDKTSICFSVRANVPGALYLVLEDLYENHIQMTKVESRPMKSMLGAYYFLVDFEGHRTDPEVADTLERMQQKCAMLKVFGSYPRDTSLPDYTGED
jgi:prephenate dehydratase